MLNLAMLFQVVLKVNLFGKPCLTRLIKKVKGKNYTYWCSWDNQTVLVFIFLIKKGFLRFKKLDGTLMTIYCPTQIDVQIILILTVPVIWVHKTINCRIEHELL